MGLDANDNTNNQKNIFDCKWDVSSIPLPPCFNDNQRINVLFSPFRVRVVNPENYDSKLKFWEDMIKLYCRHTGSGVFSILDLQTAYQHGDKIPSGLDTVILELLKVKKIRNKAEYENDPLNGWASWVINGLVWRPLSWGVNKLKSAIGYENRRELHIKYVFLSVFSEFLQELTREVLEQNRGKLLHYTEFRNLVHKVHTHLTDETIRLCLHTLHCQKRLALQYKIEGNARIVHLVKIPANNDPPNCTFSEMDNSLHQLRIMQSTLRMRLEELEKDVSSIDQKVRQLVNDNKRSLAKTYLRKKHQLEKNHEKRYFALQNIEDLINSIEEAHYHGKIIDAYKIGSRAFQQVLVTSGLKYENVEEVIFEMRELFDVHREIKDALTNISGVDSTLTNIEDLQLDQELNKIIDKEIIFEAPDIPQHKPNLDFTINQCKSDTPYLMNTQDQQLHAIFNQLKIKSSSPNSNNKSLAC